MPKWARTEVSRGVAYLSAYAASGEAFDPESGISVSGEQIIAPDVLAYEAWQLAIAHRAELSKQRGAGNEFLQKCNVLKAYAANFMSAFEGANAELEGLRKMGAITEAIWEDRVREARRAYKVATQAMAADVVIIMNEILGTERRPKHDDAIRDARKRMDERATRTEAIRATVAASSPKTRKEMEALRRALSRGLPASDN